MQITNIEAKALVGAIRALHAIQEKKDPRWFCGAISIKKVDDTTIQVLGASPYMAGRALLHCDASDWEGEVVIPEIAKYGYNLDKAWRDKILVTQPGTITYDEHSGRLELTYGDELILSREERDARHDKFPFLDTLFSRNFRPVEKQAINLDLLARISRATKPLFQSTCKIVPYDMSTVKGNMTLLMAWENMLLTGCKGLEFVVMGLQDNK